MMRIQHKQDGSGAGGSPTKSPASSASRSTLLTPNKPKVSFLESIPDPPRHTGTEIWRLHCSSTSVYSNSGNSGGNVTPSQLLQRSSTYLLGSATREKEINSLVFFLLLLLLLLWHRERDRDMGQQVINLFKCSNYSIQLVI
jgi:hypothetical protein